MLSPRLLFRLLSGCFLALLAVLLAMPALAAPASQPVVVLHDASVQYRLADQTPVDEGPIRLPYVWDRRHGAIDGEATLVLQFHLVDTDRPLALFIPRLGNTFHISLNGRELATFGTVPPNLYDDSALEPHLFVVPPAMLFADNTLEVRIGALAARQGGLSAVTLGPEREVREMFDRTHLWQVSGSRFVVIVSAVLGALAMLLWWRQRDPAYLYYGAGELLWSLQTIRTLFEHAPMAWPWWGVLPLAAFNAAPPLLCRFALTVTGYGQGVIAKITSVLIVLALPVAMLTMLGGKLWLIPVWQAVMTLTSVAMAVAVVYGAARGPLRDKRVLAVAVAVIVACAVRDVLVLRTSPDMYQMVPWVRFAWVGFGLSLAWLIAERMRRDSTALKLMNATLNAQLEARNAELTAAFERERDSTRERGALEERQRLMRDLHDGLGSQLVGALRMAQQPAASKDEIVGHLREAVDQLKITVDAMQETDGDIPSLLGALRYRLSPRLNAAGIQLHWDVGRLPVMPGWGVREAYQLQMLLFEAFANMIVHSGATEASLSARKVTGEMPSDWAPDMGGRVPADSGWSDAVFLEIEILDNGKGFDVDRARQGSGKGLSNMHMRAKALGARIAIHSEPGLTHVIVRLPL